MKFETRSNGFLGSDEGKSFETSYARARAIVVPFGFEATVSYGGGTKRGPAAIIEASHQVEVLDEQSLRPVYKAGIATLKPPPIPREPGRAIALLAKVVAQIVADGKFPVVLGGEHSLTQGMLAGVSSKYKDLSVLHFDAHMDLRPSYHGSPYSHASFMAQSLKKLPIKNVVQVGIRNISPAEKKFYEQNKKHIKVFWGWEEVKQSDIVKSLRSKNVFITFDVDAFDPAIMPSTGTPEPGGLLWWPTLAILKKVFAIKNVVGADVVELAPIKNLHAPDFMAARLVYKMIGYKFD